MPAKFDLIKPAGGTMCLSVTRDDGETLSFAADDNCGAGRDTFVRTYLAQFNADSQPVNGSYVNEITPEYYLERLADFLGYTLMPPSTWITDHAELERRAQLYMTEHGTTAWVQAMKLIIDLSGFTVVEARSIVSPIRTAMDYQKG